MTSKYQNDLSNIFRILGDRPTETLVLEKMDALEKYILDVYNPKRHTESLTGERVDQFYQI